MFRAFQKIRRTLMSEKRISKYLLYATGEVILIVVGILLALQLNNWNEARKTKEAERKTLTELRSDLEQNLEDIASNINGLTTCREANQAIMNHMTNHLPYHDSLDQTFSNLYPFVVFSPIQTTYDNLKQSGIGLISSSELRADISNLYSNRFSFYKSLEEKYFLEHFTNYIKPIMMSEFVTYGLEGLQPRDYDELMLNTELMQIMNYTITICEVLTNVQRSLQMDIETLLEDIDEEIAE